MFFANLLPEIPPCSIQLSQPYRRPIIVFTDGRYERALDAPAGVGFVIATPLAEFETIPLPSRDSKEWSQSLAIEYSFYHGSSDVPAEMMDSLCQRSQQIGQVELLGALTPYLSAPELFAHRDVLHFIDNTSAQTALMKGYSGVPDSARLVHLFHAWNLGAQCRVWFEYVPSKANVSDAPSRIDMARRVYRISDDIKSSPVFCRLPPLARWSDPAGWAREAAQHCSDVPHAPHFQFN